MSKKPVAPPKNNILTWVIPVMALAILGGYLLGQRAGSADAAADAFVPAASAATAATAATAGTAGAATTDIASMSPQERANHLYDRVMRYSELKKLDSVRIFAPMALQAYASLGTADAHVHYDVGMIWAAVGDSLKARAEAETILNERPTHLLGLLLAMRTAANESLRETYRRRFVASSKVELAIPLPEYEDHKHDIDGALASAAPPGK
jgi:hypothetical protein